MIIRRLLLIVIAGLLVLNGACAETLCLPSGTQMIGEESFAGCETLTKVVVSEGVRSIGDRAFAGCGALLEAVLPASVETMGEDCLSDCSEAILINCEPDSAALEYARANGMDYDADTVSRALIIGQTYRHTIFELEGPENDVRAVADCLKNQKMRPFDVNIQMDLTASQILSCAANAFAGATDRDISLVHYSGHGDKNGELIGTDQINVSPQELRAVLDTVPGRKIIIVDACYSGNWVSEGAAVCAEEASENVNFADAFVRGFVGRTKSAGEYYVIAAADEDEESWEKLIVSGSKKKRMGCFTYSFLMGCGWNGVEECAVDMAADDNGDGAVSIAEAFDYAEARTKEMYYGQHAQTNAADCTSFAPFR